MSGLPLVALLFGVAHGLVVPLWLYAFAIAWCLLMPVWMRRRSPGEPHAHGLPGRIGVDPRGGEPSPCVREEASRVAREVAELVSRDVLELHGWEVRPGGIVLRGAFRASPTIVQDTVAEAALAVLGRRPRVMVHADDDHEPYVVVPTAEWERVVAETVPRRRPWLSLGLALATLTTTTLAGVAHQGLNLLEQPGAWSVGLPYAVGVMLILGIHEMGHYATARRHGVRVSLPYFIPIPFALGTFGAFISMPPLIDNRRQLFDIGVAGPLAGLAVAIPALVVGLQWSEVLAVAASDGSSIGHGVSINSSALLAIVSKLSLGDRMLEGHYLVLHPLAFAGWLGLMITALNLLPVGQLDGGHVAHALVGRARAESIGKVALFSMVLLGLFVWSGLLVWALLVYFIAGTRGMPLLDDVTGLDSKRKAVGVLSLGVLALILLPVPHTLSPAVGLHCPYL